MLTTPIAVSTLCAALLGGGQICFKSDYITHDQSAGERAVIITCADPAATAYILNVPRCTLQPTKK